MFACATSSNIEVDANLRGSIERLFEQQRLEGYAKLKSQSEFRALLSLFPEQDRAKVYELYVHCIRTIFSGQMIDRSEANNRFLARVTESTTYAAFVQHFGEPEEKADLRIPGLRAEALHLLRFRTAEEATSFVVARDRANRHVMLGLFTAAENRTVNYILFLHMGGTPNSQGGGSSHEHQGANLTTITLDDLGSVFSNSLAPRNSPYETRHHHFTVGPCHFGRPGSFKEYFLAFGCMTFPTTEDVATRLVSAPSTQGN